MEFHGSYSTSVGNCLTNYSQRVHGGLNPFHLAKNETISRTEGISPKLVFSVVFSAFSEFMGENFSIILFIFTLQVSKSQKEEEKVNEHEKTSDDFQDRRK